MPTDKKLLTRNNRLIYAEDGKALTTECRGCCGQGEMVTQASECCDGNPIVYIRNSIYEAFNCPPDFTGTLGFRYDGKCYRINILIQVTLEQARQLGYRIIESPSEVICIVAPEGQTVCKSPLCRACPQTCCKTFIVGRDCRTPVDPIRPRNNICCNWGAHYKLTAFDFQSTINITNNIINGDPCGCIYVEVQREVLEATARYTEEVFMCNPDGMQIPIKICSYIQDENRTLTTNYNFQCSVFQTQRDSFPVHLEGVSCTRFANSRIVLFPLAEINPDTGLRYPCTYTSTKDEELAGTDRRLTRTTVSISPYNCLSGTYSKRVDFEDYAPESACGSRFVYYEQQNLREWSWSVQKFEDGNILCEGNAFCENYYDSDGGGFTGDFTDDEKREKEIVIMLQENQKLSALDLL